MAAFNPSDSELERKGPECGSASRALPQQRRDAELLRDAAKELKGAGTHRRAAGRGEGEEKERRREGEERRRGEGALGAWGAGPGATDLPAEPPGGSPKAEPAKPVIWRQFAYLWSLPPFSLITSLAEKVTEKKKNKTTTKKKKKKSGKKRMVRTRWL